MGVGGRRVKKEHERRPCYWEDLLHVMGGLWICSRGGGDTALGAYIGENGLDDVEVGHLCALCGDKWGYSQW